MAKAIYDRLTVLMMSAMYFFSFWATVQVTDRWYTFTPHLHTSVATVVMCILFVLAGAASIVGLVYPRITPASCESFEDRFRMFVVALIAGSLSAFVAAIAFPLLISVVLAFSIFMTLFFRNDW